MTLEAINSYVLEATSLVASAPTVILLAWLVRTHREPFFREWVRAYTFIFLLLAFDYAHIVTGWEPALLATSLAAFVASFFMLRTGRSATGWTGCSKSPIASG